MLSQNLTTLSHVLHMLKAKLMS